MYVVIGATGQTGQVVVETLLAAGKQVRAIVRSAERGEALKSRGIEPYVAELTDAKALTKALAGAKAVYLMLPPSYGAPDVLAEADQRIAAYAQAVKAAQPGHVVVLSAIAAHLPSGNGVVAASHRLEQAIRATRLPATFLRPSYFSQNWLGFLPLAQAQGILPSFVQPLERAFKTVSTNDVGRIAADLMTGPVPQGERVANLTGPNDLAPQDIAAAIAQVLGRPVTAAAPERDSWEASLMAAGIGADYARLLAEFVDAMNDGRIVFEQRGEFRTGHDTVADVFRANLALGKAAE